MKAEEQFINVFLAPDRRKKLCAMLTNPSRRRAYLGKSLHSCDFEPAYCVEIPEENETPDAIGYMLKEAGAPDSCWVISDSEEIDGKECLLIDALRAVVGKGISTILICNTEKLGYYEGNDMEERMILQWR